MRLRLTFKSLILTVSSTFIYPALQAQVNSASKQQTSNSDGIMIILFAIAIAVLIATIFLKIKTSKMIRAGRGKKQETDPDRLNQYISNMDSKQIEAIIHYRQKKKRQDKPSGNGQNSKLLSFIVVLFFSMYNQNLFAQTGEKG